VLQAVRPVTLEARVSAFDALRLLWSVLPLDVGSSASWGEPWQFGGPINSSYAGRALLRRTNPCGWRRTNSFWGLIFEFVCTGVGFTFSVTRVQRW
jgi:hypothetical protein